VARAAEADLSTPAEGPFGAWTNFAEMFAFANSHCWCHTGKISTLRAMLGKPRSIRVTRMERAGPEKLKIA
jgi:hypothetical protein